MRPRLPPRHIVFYGTLMRGFPLRERSGIDEWIRFTGCGDVAGALFDLGPYPGLTAAAGRVRGEVYDLVAAGPLLARADAIERFEPADPAASEYVRRAVACRLDDGRTLEVWAYFYNRSIAAAEPVPDGDYRRHLARTSSRRRESVRFPANTGRAPGPGGGFAMIQVCASRDAARRQRMAFETIGVVGCGLMGSGIAQVSAQAGYRTIVREVDDATVAAGIGRIESFLAAGVERGKVSADDRDRTLANLSGTSRLDDLAGCDLVIEAIVEDVGAKRDVFAALEGMVGPETVLASNTSSLCITELASATRRPERFVGLHFFSPVPIMKLVEVIRGLATSDATFESVAAFSRSVGKDPVRAPDRPGFIANRLLIPYLLDAIRAHEEGVGTIEDIDKTMALGCGYPMGPFTLLDFVGLDTTCYIAGIMYDEFKDPRYAPPPLLKRMVLAGRHGRKTGRGFYTY